MGTRMRRKETRVSANVVNLARQSDEAKPRVGGTLRKPISTRGRISYNNGCAFGSSTMVWQTVTLLAGLRQWCVLDTDETNSPKIMWYPQSGLQGYIDFAALYSSSESVSSSSLDSAAWSALVGGGSWLPLPWRANWALSSRSCSIFRSCSCLFMGLFFFGFEGLEIFALGSGSGGADWLLYSGFLSRVARM